MTDLAQTIEAGDVGKTGEVLRQALEPFAMHPSAEGYRMKGALDRVGVRDELSSGGVLRPDRSRRWMALELVAA